MKVQRIQIEKADCLAVVSWLVLNDDHLPIKPVCEFLRYLETAARSPNTVRSYAYHLCRFFLFLKDSDLEWKKVKFIDLSHFIEWLRDPPPVSNVININQASQPKRSDSSINTIISAVAAFYQFQERIGNVPPLIIQGWQQSYGSPRYKPFLHHITKGQPQKLSLLKLKVPRKNPPVLTSEEVGKLVNACHRIRDRYLVCLLYETGMRIGQALGLRHEDIRSFDNYISIVPRSDNVNRVRAKTFETYNVHVSKELMAIYSDYLITEFNVDSDYVFVNLWEAPLGRPFSYNAAKDLFNRLGRKTGIKVRPHLLRHTNATELLRDGWDASHVQKRLGHRSILTTINIYSHLNDEDLKDVYQDYLERRESRRKDENK